MRIFLLSPARLDGERAKLLYRDEARFPLALQLRTPGGAALGDTFAFLSGLYFRGKLAYARRFAPAPGSAFLITSDRGLVPPDTRVTLDDLRSMAEVPIAVAEPRYRDPLVRDVIRLCETHEDATFVLLGSVATAKYVDPLLGCLGDRLLFPRDFVGRGDMSRGGLLLRQVDAGEELAYIPLKDAQRKGSRPPRLTPRRRA